MPKEKKEEKREVRKREDINTEVNKTGANLEYVLEVLLDIRDLLTK